MLRRQRPYQEKAGTVRIVVSDGLNRFAITDPGDLPPYLEALRIELAGLFLAVAPNILVMRRGRVRAGYRIGEVLFSRSGEENSHRAIVHLIGERPGGMHHTFSAYITAPPFRIWNKAGQTDHNITRVVFGIAADALLPQQAAALSARVVQMLMVHPTMYQS